MNVSVQARYIETLSFTVSLKGRLVGREAELESLISKRIPGVRIDRTKGRLRVMPSGSFDQAVRRVNKILEDMRV
jgi:hypothetical protein